MRPKRRDLLKVLTTGALIPDAVLRSLASSDLTINDRSNDQRENVDNLSEGATLDLMMLSGIDMNPVYLWMKGGKMMARIAGNLHIVHEQDNSLRLELKQKQGKIEEDYLKGIARQLTTPIEKAGGNFYDAKALYETQGIRHFKYPNLL